MADYLLVLGNKNYSSWSMRAWLVVRQAGVPFEEIVVPLDTPETAREITAHSPSGLVPVLKHENVTVWDSLAIAEYMAEQCPNTGLWPAEPSVRAVARSVAAEMHSGFRALRAELPMNIRADKHGRAWTAEAEADIRRVEALWTACRDRYGAGGDFLFGAWSAADAMYAPVVTRFQTYGAAVGATATAYMAAVRAEPMVATFAEAAAAEPWTVDKYDRL